MRVVLLGSPGSGKGTQASKIEERYSIPHISTGDIFRKHIKEQTKIGLEVKKIMDMGLLVPDELVLSVLEDRLMEPDCENGYLLDGFPRTLLQAETLLIELDNIHKDLDAAINISVRDEVIIDRMTGRRTCNKCGAIYNLSFGKPKVENTCDVCGGKLYIRDDDKLETVANRLEVYKTNTKPLIDFFDKKGLLTTVDGERAPEVVFKDICRTLEKVK